MLVIALKTMSENQVLQLIWRWGVAGWRLGAILQEGGSSH
jgi:hypothetical protein